VRYALLQLSRGALRVAPVSSRDSGASIIVLCLLCFLSPGISGCTKRAPSSAAPARILRVSQRNEPADLDPATAALPDEFFIIRALSEGLVSPTADGNTVEPAAAERWEFSADGLTCTFHLRSDAFWSNGEPVTAQDFADSYQRLLTPATAASKASLFFMVKNARAFASGAIADFSAVGIRAADAHTLVISLDRPMPRFLSYAASGPWIPVNPRVVAKAGRAWTRPENYVGNGPFALAEWRPHQRIVVKKNPRYHAATSVRLDAIHFIAFDNGDTEERAFRAGQIDITMAVPVTKLETYARERPAELRRAPLAETRYLTFNTMHPPLNDARVRRALALAIDRDLIVDRVTRGGQQPASRFIPPTLASSNSPTSDLHHDPAAARQLLAAAGFADGKNFPRLELTAWSPSQSPVIEAVQAMWRKELGLDIAVAIRDAKVHLAALQSGDYDIAFATTATLTDVMDPLALLENFARNSANNHARWDSPDFDRALASAAAAGDLRVRSASLAEAESLLLEAAPVAPVYFNNHNFLISPRVHGWREDPLWARNYLGVYLVEK